MVQWCCARRARPDRAPRAEAADGDDARASLWRRERLAHKTRVATECVWRRGLTKKGPGLCHGASGNGYALLVAARALMPVDPILGRLLEARAKRFALWVTEHAAELAAERAIYI